MRKSFHNQSGISFLGLVLVLGLIAIMTLFALRLFPLYTQKFAVITSMNTVAARPEVVSGSKQEIAKLLEKNFSINSVTAIPNSTREIRKHMKIIKHKDGSPPTLQIFFEMDNVLVADIFLKLNFQHEVPLTGP